MNQIVYILTNEAMPGLVKIGMTERELETRIAELSRATGVPLPFVVHYAAKVNNAAITESLLLEAFSMHRINPLREFFKLSPENAVAALKIAQGEDITPREDVVEFPEEAEALQNARARLPRFNFEIAEIPLGASLVFTRDSSKIAKYIGNSKIEFEGRETSLSESARIILNRTHAPAGTEYWTYEGEILSERISRIRNQILESHTN
jgi:T5orf172 domain